MSRIRTALAAALAVATLGVWMATPAHAGYNIDLASDIDCDTSRGEWVVKYTLRGDNSSSTSILSGTYLLSGGPSGEAGELTFAPTTLDQDSPSYATLRLPGSSIGTLLATAEAEFTSAATREDELDGSCQRSTPPEPPVPPTPTTSTTVAVADEAVAATPAFTG